MEIHEFVAWVLDFEGSIGIGKHQHSERSLPNYLQSIRVNGTSLELLHAFQRRCGFGHVNPNPSISPNSNALFVWSMRADEIRQHLPSILPYLTLKQEQAALVIQLLELKRPRAGSRGIRDPDITRQMHNLYLECSVLNERKLNPISAQESFLRDLRRR